jgi:hypothetical protein
MLGTIYRHMKHSVNIGVTLLGACVGYGICYHPALHNQEWEISLM